MTAVLPREGRPSLQPSLRDIIDRSNAENPTATRAGAPGPRQAARAARRRGPGSLGGVQGGCARSAAPGTAGPRSALPAAGRSEIRRPAGRRCAPRTGGWAVDAVAGFGEAALGRLGERAAGRGRGKQQCCEQQAGEGDPILHARHQKDFFRSGARQHRHAGDCKEATLGDRIIASGIRLRPTAPSHVADTAPAIPHGCGVTSSRSPTDVPVARITPAGSSTT